jgi:flagellar hook-associated protein 2
MHRTVGLTRLGSNPPVAANNMHEAFGARGSNQVGFGGFTGNGNFTITIDGVQHDITLNNVQSMTNNQIETAINNGLAGTNVEAYIGSNGRLSFIMAPGTTVSLADGTGNAAGTLEAMGFTAGGIGFHAGMSFADFMDVPTLTIGANVAVGSPGATVNSAPINFSAGGVDFRFTRTLTREYVRNASGAFVYQNGVRQTRDVQTDTLSRLDSNGNLVTPPMARGQNLSINQVMNTINGSEAGVRMSFNALSGRFTMESASGAGNSNVDFSGTFFDRIGFDNSPGGYYRPASSAVIYIDDVRITRTTNNFEVDGLRFNIDPHAFWDSATNSSIIDPNDATTFIQMEVNLARDTSTAMNTIRNFVDGFNEMMRNIRALTEVRRPRMQGSREFFMPLTDEQRRAMSEREIDLWESQARTGLLHRDSDLRRLQNDLHSWVTQGVRLEDGTSLGLLQMGIRTARNMEDFGQLEIDEDRLQWFLDNRIEDVTRVFRGPKSLPPATGDRMARLRAGSLADRVNDIMTWATNSTGSLTRRAGIVGGPSEHQNAMSRRIEAEDRRIDNMIRNLERREARYFQKFSRMEMAMMQADSQMAWMQQMFFQG